MGFTPEEVLAALGVGSDQLGRTAGIAFRENGGVRLTPPRARMVGFPGDSIDGLRRTFACVFGLGGTGLHCVGTLGGV